MAVWGARSFPLTNSEEWSQGADATLTSFSSERRSSIEYLLRAGPAHIRVLGKIQAAQRGSHEGLSGYV